MNSVKNITNLQPKDYCVCDCGWVIANVEMDLLGFDAACPQCGLNLQRFRIAKQREVKLAVMRMNKASAKLADSQSDSSAKLIETKNSGRTLRCTLVDADQYNELNEYDWFVTNGGSAKGYACRRYYDKGTKRRVLVSMHRQIVGEANIPDGYEVDHVDRNSLNNQRSNLRVVTRSVNLLNQKRGKETSGVYGFGINKSVYNYETKNGPVTAVYYSSRVPIYQYDEMGLKKSVKWITFGNHRTLDKARAAVKWYKMKAKEDRSFVPTSKAYKQYLKKHAGMSKKAESSNRSKRG